METRNVIAFTLNLFSSLYVTILNYLENLKRRQVYFCVDLGDKVYRLLNVVRREVNKRFLHVRFPSQLAY